MMGRKWGGFVPSERKLDVAEIDSLVIAGWTGRNVEALEAHIKELEAIGVKRPKSVPIFYRVARSLLTTGPAIEVMADKSSGEVEFVLYALQDGLWLGVGSDHTDRKAETMGIALSKQLCAKPVGRDAWLLDDVAPHWDQLQLRAFATIDGRRVTYQEGTLAGMRTPTDLIARYGKALAPNTLMFCGTLAAIGGIRPASRFEVELTDPVLNRTLKHAYDIDVLPVVS
jgi:hypothetical protein